MKNKILIRKIIIYALYIIILSAIQVSFSDTLILFGQVADLMLVFVIVCGYLFGTKDAIFVGLITGFFRDYYSGPALGGSPDQPSAIFGIGMLLLLYAGVLSSVLFKRAFHRKLPLAFVQVMIVTVAYKAIGHAIVLGVQILSGNGSEYLSLISILIKSILPQLLINLIAVVPIIFMMKYFGPYKKGINPDLSDEKSDSEAIWQSV